MTDVMVHRGPDDRGTHREPGIALGMRRLSIVDVAGGHQPFFNETGDVWAVQNGELYNHGDVRRDLARRGHALQTHCDSEVLPHLYEEMGERFACGLRGKFGIAVWDARNRRTVLARDRLGIKPLYYAEVGDLLVFGSELKSVLASGLVDPQLDYAAVDAFMTLGFVPSPRTLLARVRKLPPGHYLVVEDGGYRIERYWSYPEPVVDRRLTVEEYREGLIEELEESVRLRLMSDVPLGAMLSGGLDSSLIVALMARNMSEPVKTFAVGFSDEHEVNELDDARFVASCFGAEHHELELSFDDDTVDLEELIWHLDEPIADLSALGFHGVSALAARHVTVALAGQGADELLGGYKKHRAASLVGAWKRLPRPLTAAGESLALRGPGRFQRAARTLAARDPAERLIEMSGRLGGGLRETLYRGPMTGFDGSAALEAAYECLNGTPDEPLSSTLHIDGQLALVDDMLHYFDRASMAHSLEVRVPFLDHSVVEFCARVPSDLKVRRLQTKYLLKEAAAGIVPDRIIHKRKLGFLRGSSEAWLQTQLRTAAKEYLLTPSARYGELLDRAYVERLLIDHRDGRDTGNVHLLIGILMLELWLSSYLPRAL